METGYRTPLLDYFRRGDAPRDVKLLAARGELAPRAHEQVALLVHLLEDADSEIASLAAATLDAIPEPTLQGFLARSDVSQDLRSFFAARGVTAGGQPPADPDRPLIEVDVMDEPGQPSTPALSEVAESGAVPDPAGEVEEGSKTGVQIGSLAVPAKLKLAMQGTREQRGVLIRDSNRIVAAAVLSSPKLTEAEVEGFARMANVAEEVLRVIGTSRVWTRNYVIAASLVKNPKTPPAISLTMLPRLTERDLKFVSIDRGVSEAVRVAARKFLAAGQSRRG